jgi:16S rRNA (guanine(1405)-N(7))-methyltransferase
MPSGSSDLETVVHSVLAGGKRRTLAPALVRAVAAQELAKGRSVKEAAKATKNRLHQAAGAYADDRPDYPAWARRLEEAGGDPDALRAACRAVMAHHASARERLPLLDAFYTMLFAGLPPVASVLDLACGLNPLAIPWMPLAPGATYVACDVYADLAEFLDGCWPHFGVSGRAVVHSLLDGPPPVPADVALLLKTLPCLEQLDRSIGLPLLDAVDAPVLFVSFPGHSLGGREKGMRENYEQHFRALVAGRPWEIEKHDFGSEVVFRVRKAVEGFNSLRVQGMGM